LAEMSRRKPILKNRTPPEIEAQIVALSLEQPAYGQIRVSNELVVDFTGRRARCLAAP
jgi:hypothetical protein